MNDFKSDTPRTDNILKIASIEDRYVPLVDLSRQLERELSEAISLQNFWKSAYFEAHLKNIPEEPK